ncbi:hypothetical protein JI739_05075 [Ramlibacter sp. AW1]|uniref:Uncharacterized protein n=1 Tax=Ramlibacter aurantiacus TaxID=2801330 RepID=A0A936ZH23_9BURK|nr:hypothetical protein [Ramlibacter aurantiacus]MBL0419717.1 hypothetical protein [Ramlibacter aurantiacus]
MSLEGQSIPARWFSLPIGPFSYGAEDGYSLGMLLGGPTCSEADRLEVLRQWFAAVRSTGGRPGRNGATAILEGFGEATRMSLDEAAATYMRATCTDLPASRDDRSSQDRAWHLELRVATLMGHGFGGGDMPEAIARDLVKAVMQTSLARARAAEGRATHDLVAMHQGLVDGLTTHPATLTPTMADVLQQHLQELSGEFLGTAPLQMALQLKIKLHADPPASLQALWDLQWQLLADELSLRHPAADVSDELDKACAELSRQLAIWAGDMDSQVWPRIWLDVAQPLTSNLSDFEEVRRPPNFEAFIHAAVEAAERRGRFGRPCDDWLVESGAELASGLPIGHLRRFEHAANATRGALNPSRQRMVDCLVRGFTGVASGAGRRELSTAPGEQAVVAQTKPSGQTQPGS